MLMFGGREYERGRVSQYNCSLMEEGRKEGGVEKAADALDFRQ